MTERPECLTGHIYLIEPSDVLFEIYLETAGPRKMATQGEYDHPYIPREMKLPGFVPGVLSQLTILAVYGCASVLVASSMWILSGTPQL